MSPASPTPSGPEASSPAHVPVLLDRIVELLSPVLERRGAVFLDATLGLGGHSEALLRRHPHLRLIGIDRDRHALAASATRLAPFAERAQLVPAVYDQLDRVLAERAIDAVDGVLFDLGVSSMQLDMVNRGFSYAHDAPLDMRMDTETPLTAQDIVNTYSVPELTRVLREFGEERFAQRIARRIETRRAERPFTSSADLAQVVRDAIPAATRTASGHPAKRTFQALRIEVNAELDAVTGAIPAALQALRPGGRIAVLAYHSLEDRIVKQNFSDWAADHTPLGLPVPLPSAQARLRLLTRGAQRASEEEMIENPRAKSARLRAAERIGQ